MGLMEVYMSENNDNAPLDEQSDDSLAYLQAQAAEEAVDDPLAAIKNMRLEQLALCRLKSQEEMRAIRQSSQAAETEQDEDS